jgi:hypothetical protein
MGISPVAIVVAPLGTGALHRVVIALALEWSNWSIGFLFMGLDCLLELKSLKGPTDSRKEMIYVEKPLTLLAPCLDCLMSRGVAPACTLV